MAATHWEYYCYFLDRGAFIFYAYSIIRNGNGAQERMPERGATI